MAIYTRTGDSGSTSLFTGQRVSKTHLRVETYGTLDELNATLSLCYCATAIESHRILLEAIQQQIFWFSAELASESEQPSAQLRYIGTEEIAALENAIDSAMNAVPPVHSFILPGRCEAASRMHFARTVARRAERRLVELTTETIVRNVLLHYINRLSDCLYALARVEDNVAHQNLMIQEITKRYHAQCRSLFRIFTSSFVVRQCAQMNCIFSLSSALLMPTEQKVLPGGCLMPCWSAVNWHRKKPGPPWR